MPIVTGIQANVFRAVSGSLFSTAANWSRGYVPTGSDAVDIRDNCIIDINRTIGSLVVQPGFTASINTGLTLQVNDAINILGHLSCSGAPNIISLAKKNNISSLSPGSSSFLYNGTNQNVPGGPYFDLTIYGSGVKTVTSNTIVNRSLSLGTGIGPSGFLELGPYDLSVYGSTTVGANGYGVLSKSKFGNLLFVGSFANGNTPASVRFSDGNPNVEFRSGVTTTNSNPALNTILSGTGTWTFTSPTQTLSGWASFAPLNLDANIIISSSAVLNIYGWYYVSNPINGSGPSSNLVMLANSGLVFTTAKALTNSMTTGGFDFTSSYNAIGIGGNYSATIPSRFSSFRDLVILGTGIKSLGTSSYVSGALTINSGGTFDFGAYNMDVVGTTTIVGNLNKTSSGNVLFRGLLALQNSASPKLNFSGSIVNVELRNGLTYGNGADPISSGLGTWTFTTNNQAITHVSSLGPNVTLDCPIVVSGAITLTNSSNTPLASTLTINNSVNGTEANSKFVNSNILSIANASFPQPMTIGIFDITSSVNTLIYSFNGNYTIPYTSFSSLNIVSSGSKTLSANTTIKADLYLPYGILELSNYDLIVSGTTTIRNTSGLGYGTISKNGPGNIIFVGQLFSPSGGEINFSGNPNIEFKNGFSYLNSIFTNTGTGSWNFTTNNQSLNNGGGTPTNYLISASILISGITLTISSFNASSTLTLTNTVNGSNPSSTLLMGSNAIVYYNNAAQPMITGNLDASTNLNTFIYNSGSQNVKGGTYRNLTMFSGSKTLQGNVSVLGTLNTGSGAGLATINYNGFTLTNP